MGMQHTAGLIQAILHTTVSSVCAFGAVCGVHFTTGSRVVYVCQGRSTKIKTGQAIDDMTQTRGAADMPPGKFLKFRCSVSTFGAILGPSTLQ